MADLLVLQKEHLRRMLRLLFFGRDENDYTLATFVTELTTLRERGFAAADIVEVVFDELPETRHRLQVMDLFVQDATVLPVLERHGWARNGCLSLPHNISHVYSQRWLDNLARSMQVDLAVDTTVWPLEEKARIKRDRKRQPVRNPQTGEIVMVNRLRRSSVNFARSITLKQVILPDATTIYPGGRTIKDLPDYPILGLYLPGCPALEVVDIPAEASICYLVLAGCTRVKKVRIRGKVTGRIDLAGLSSLEELELDRGCGNLHIHGCHKLRRLVLPAKGRYSDVNISDCDMLEEIEVGRSTKIYGNLNMIRLPALKRFETDETVRIGGWCDQVTLCNLEVLDMRGRVGVHRVPPHLAGQEAPGRIGHPELFPAGISLGMEPTSGL